MGAILCGKASWPINLASNLDGHAKLLLSMSTAIAVRKKREPEMHLTDDQAAQRVADRENRQAELARRKRNNMLMNIAALGVMVYVAVVELIRHGVL